MKLLFLFLTILSFFVINAQQNFTEFPGTGFGLKLPDSSFHLTDHGFMSRKYRASLMLVNMESEPDLSNFRYEKMVEMMLKEIRRPGTTILLDKTVAPGRRIIKTGIAFDSTDNKPATKGKSGIIWSYFFEYKGAPLIVVGSYDSQHDAILNDYYFTSLTSFTVVDSQTAKKFFKNKFSITEDYAPLIFCGESTGGIRLNMQGRYDIKSGDSSYCLVIPMDIPFPSVKMEDVRTYLHKQLQIKENADVNVVSFGMGTTLDDPFTSYYMIGRANHDKLMYLCIKSDETGYFEIWGEAYHNNTALVDIFRKISSSLRRN